VAGNGEALRSRGPGAAGRPVPGAVVHAWDRLFGCRVGHATAYACESTVQLGPCHGVTVPETPDRPEEVRAVKLAQSLLAMEAAACKLIRKGRAS
jgi:hypothetical protein